MRVKRKLYLHPAFCVHGNISKNFGPSCSNMSRGIVEEHFLPLEIVETVLSEVVTQSARSVRFLLRGLNFSVCSEGR